MVFGVCNPDAEEDMVCGADPGPAVEVSGVEAALLSPPWLSSPAGVTLRFFHLRLRHGFDGWQRQTGWWVCRLERWFQGRHVILEFKGRVSWK